MGEPNKTIIAPKPPPDGPPPGFTFTEGSEATQEAMADFQAERGTGLDGDETPVE